MSFRQLKRDCPICQGARTDCRENRTNSLIHCRCDDVDHIPGYRFVKQDANGFNMWALDDGRDSGEDWQEVRRQRKAERERRAEEEYKRRIQGLPIEERDREYRTLNQQLSLSPTHRQVLRDRGLTDAEINLAVELSAVRSWVPGQTASGVSPRLAGINPVNGMLTNVDGMAIYAFDPNGRIGGAQLKTDNNSFGKYLWISSASKKGSSPHLRETGDLPLFVWKHPDTTYIEEVWLCEGALKSILAAVRLWRQGRTDIAVIGTASSARLGSRTLKAYLEVLSPKTIRLMPDAGAVLNKNVHQANTETLEKCTRWGYDIKVGWWHQANKGRPDIDELDDFKIINYLTPDDFLFEAKQAQYREEAKKANEKLNKLSYPALEVNQRYLNFSFPATGISFVKSPMGSGKTELIKSLNKECEDNGKRLLLLGSRNGLLYQTCQRTDIDHLWHLQVPKDSQLTGLLLRHNDTLAMCVDSVWRLMEKDWDGATLVIDEIESVTEHLLIGKTCSDRRAVLCTKYQKHIEHVIKTGGRVIIMDAGLTDVPIDYIKSFVPEGTPIAGVVNQYKPEAKWKVTFHVGTQNIGQRLTNDDSAVLFAILYCLEAAGIPIVVTDSQLTGEALQRQLESHGYPGGLRVDSETSEQDPRVKDFLNNPNEWLRENRPLWLICSPTAESGISITEPHFTKMFALFKGVVNSKTQMQMLGRERSPIPREIFTVNFGFKDEDCSRQIPEEIEQRLLTYHGSNNLAIDLAGHLQTGDAVTDAERLAALNQSINPVTETWRNPHLTTWAKLKARDNYSRANLRDGLWTALTDAGHEVENVCEYREKETKEEHNGFKDEIQLEKATARANAKDIPVSQAWKILKTDSSTIEERNQAHKAILADSIPGVELTPELILKAQVEDRGRWLRSIKVDWMLDHENAQKYFDLKSWGHQLQKPFVPIQDVRAYTLQIKALNALKVKELLNRDRTYSLDSETTKTFMSNARSKENRKHLRALGLSLNHKTNPIQFMNRLLKKIGAELICFEQHREGKLVTRNYRLDPAYWEDPDRNAVWEALDRKHASLIESLQNPTPQLATIPIGQATQVSQHASKEYISTGVCCDEEATRLEAIAPPEIGSPAGLKQEAVALSTPLAEIPARQSIEVDQHASEEYISTGACCDNQMPTFVAWVARFGQQFKYRFQGLVSDGLALIQSVINGVAHEVPLAELAPWVGSGWSVGRSPA